MKNQRFFNREFVPAAQSSQAERKAWLLVWKELLKLTSEDVSLRSSKFRTEERLECGVLPMDDLCRREVAWEAV